MRALAVLLGCLGALGGLVVTLLASGPDDPAAHATGILAVSCGVALLGALLIGRGLPGWGALLLVEALVSFALWLGERALLLSVPLAVAALLAIGSRRDRRHRLERR
jgi:hypothetical protein